MLMIAVPVLVLLLAGGGAGTYFFVLKPHAATRPSWPRPTRFR